MAKMKKMAGGGSLGDLTGSSGSSGGGGGAQDGLNQINSGAQTVGNAIGQAQSALGGGGGGSNLQAPLTAGLSTSQPTVLNTAPKFGTPLQAPSYSGGPVSLNVKTGGAISHERVKKHKEGGYIKSVSRNQKAPSW